MNALDFLEVCLGVSAVVVSGAVAIRHLMDARTRSALARGPARHEKEPTGPLTQRLEDLRGSTFGKPMEPRRPPTTWPVFRVPTPPDPPQQAKDAEEKQLPRRPKK